MISLAFLSIWFMNIYWVVATNMNDVKVSYDPLNENWQHLSFDPKNFACDAFDDLCTNFLDQIDCAPQARSNFACSPDIYHYNGTCICHGNPVYQDRGSRISKLIVENRIKPEIGWMLEPWTEGPPYSVKASYTPICELLLTRLGCPAELQTIEVGSDDGTQPFECACGKFTASSVRVEELICEKIEEAELAERPIFADPVTLSIELSLAVVMIVGKLGAMLASLIYLPPIIGFLLAGVAIQDIVNVALIKGTNTNGPHSTPFSEMKVLALIVVLMRAGMTIKPHELASKGVLTVALAVIPYFAEFAVMMPVAMRVLGWDVVDTGLLVSILAALGPSLVIPGMIKMINEKLGYAPKTVLSSAPIEVVLAIILFNVFSNLELTSPNPVLPWVKVLPLWANIILIPVNILFSSVLGYICGYCVSWYFDFRNAMIGNKTVDRVCGNTTAEYAFITLVICYLLYSLCTPQYIQQTNGVLAVFSMTLTMSHYGDPIIIRNLKDAFAGLWVFLEVILFTTTGINLSFKAVTGPLQSERGITSDLAEKLCEILFLGTLGRSAGIMLVQLISYPTLKPHRKEPKYMAAWWLATWMLQWPKATVQATLGGLPFAMHIIPGAAGLSKGLLIQQASAFTVLLMASIGIFFTAFIGTPLSAYLRDQDKAAGCDDDDEDEKVHVEVVDNNAEVLKKDMDDDLEAASDSKELGDEPTTSEAATTGGYAVVASTDDAAPVDPVGADKRTRSVSSDHAVNEKRTRSISGEQVAAERRTSHTSSEHALGESRPSHASGDHDANEGRTRARSTSKDHDAVSRRRSVSHTVGSPWNPRRLSNAAATHDPDDFIETPQGLYQRVLPPSTLPYDWK